MTPGAYLLTIKPLFILQYNKGALSPMPQFFSTESPFKKMEKAP